MNEITQPRRDPPQVLLWVLLAVAVVLPLIVGGAIFLYIKSRAKVAEVSRIESPTDGSTVLAATPTVAAVPTELAAPNPPAIVSAPGDFSLTNLVTSLLGEDESGHGLIHIDNRKDGLTVIESIDGIPARVGKPSDKKGEVFFYFQIHPTFKQQDLRRVRFDVEYLAPEPGTMIIHYNAENSPNVKNAAYRDAAPIEQFDGSRRWQHATFHTQNDALFRNRQNGKSDFRIFARTPVLYVRRVTVTQEPMLDSWSVDFSTSNQVSIALGQEKSADGLRHIADERDGLTAATNLDGVICRRLNLTGPRNFFGSFYFDISPTFKATGLTNARVEVEYLATRSNAFRVQFDGLQNGTNRSYVSVVPDGANVVRRYGADVHALTPTLGTWNVATFHLTNATFRNSQNGRSDFRFEVVPPDMYVRRITVAREDAPAARP